MQAKLVLHLLTLNAIINFSFSSRTEAGSVTFVILGKPSNYHFSLAAELNRRISKECIDKKCSVLNSAVDIEVNGHWAVWTLFKRLREKHSSSWYVFLEDSSTVRVSSLRKFLAEFDHSEHHIFGCGLFDRAPTIIHHFSHEDGSVFQYPDFSCGFVVSHGSVLALLDALEHSNPTTAVPNFSIDPKHEVAVLFDKGLSLKLTSLEDKFCVEESPSCLIYHRKPTFDLCERNVESSNVHFMVKTYSGFHRSRLVVIKRTWARDLPSVEFCSDTVDRYVPTIDMGVNNTKQGHCGKTWAMLQRFAELKAENKLKDILWLVIADDDTLLSVPRLRKLLSCYDPNEKIIIGERYGFGFHFAQSKGYDYPTGGSGMVFSYPTVLAMLEKCSCPRDDSPDDMIIGMCAQSVGVDIVHNAGFHQAQMSDYAPEYFWKTPTISLHKFEGIDPYRDYMAYLYEDDSENKFVHQELWNLQKIASGTIASLTFIRKRGMIFITGHDASTNKHARIRCTRPAVACAISISHRTSTKDYRKQQNVQMGLVEAVELPFSLLTTVVLLGGAIFATVVDSLDDSKNLPVSTAPPSQLLPMALGIMSLMGIFSRRRYVITFTLINMVYAYLISLHFFVLTIYRITHNLPQTCPYEAFIKPGSDCLLGDILVLILITVLLLISVTASIGVFNRLSSPVVRLPALPEQATRRLVQKQVDPSSFVSHA
ncbi:unnamed protein product [Caenorhabditis auriculariae]|uniref:Fringe-like glycosyltransferase domain-containing protein n=1 Tax=Caenorhabditis auriculariae TaxID=2777116 RepID=A0A8S1GV78_9PELO|nr:unnamed protein product [Caenorhabditis auriculariae]